jgi:hypothetical protein
MNEGKLGSRSPTCYDLHNFDRGRGEKRRGKIALAWHLSPRGAAAATREEGGRRDNPRADD